MGSLTDGPAPRAPILRNAEIKQYLYENAILGETRRFRQIDRYEAAYLCSFYNHLPLDWDGLSADQIETVSPEIQVPFGFTQPALDAKVRQKRPTAPSNVCLAGDQRIVLSSGELARIDEFRGGAVWTANEGLKTASCGGTPSIQTKTDYIREVHLRSGRTVRATHDHLVYAATSDGFGWVPIERLGPGDFMAAPRTVPVDGRGDISMADAVLAGFMVGDGSAVTGISFHNQNESVVEAFVRAAEARHLRVTRMGFGKYSIGGAAFGRFGGRAHALRGKTAKCWARHIGINGLRAWEKRAPRALFNASADKIAAFLGALWDTDGCIVRDTAEAVLVTSSRGLADDAQDLLLRLGIAGHVRFRQMTNRRPNYGVFVSGRAIAQFAQLIPLSHSRKAELLKKHAKSVARREPASADYTDIIPSAWRIHAKQGYEQRKGRGLSRFTLKQIAERGGEDFLYELATSNVRWVRIESVSDSPPEPVYDISVPGAECFFAENSLVHNCRSIVDRFTGLLFGESRRPEVMVEGDPDTEEFLAAVREQCRWWPKWREARTIGGATGSVMVTVHVRNGRFALDIHNPKHCQVVWRDRRTLTPAAALICYRYPVEVEDIDPKTGKVIGTKIVSMLARRIITEHDDTVYKPALLDGNEVDLSWHVESTVEHGLGFFPGVWIQNRPVLQDEDGDPDCQGAWQSIDTYDRMLAQMNKGALLNLDPTPVIKSDPKEVMALMELRKGSDNAIYVGASGDARYMEITGSGIAVGEKVLSILENNIMRVTRCVWPDAEKLSGAAQSAKAMEYLMASMLEAADDLRAQYGDLGCQPLMVMVEKIARKLDGQEVELPPAADGTRRVGKTTFDLPPRRLPNGKLVPQKLGPGGYIRIKWGPYFAPTENDKQLAINNAVSAQTGGLIDRETGVKAVAPVFEVRDVAGMVKRVAAEQQAEMEMGMPELGMTDDSPASGPMEAAPAPAPTPPKPPSLAPAAIASILKVNEARAMIGLGPLLTETGEPDPDGFLTVVEFQARHSGDIAAAARTEQATEAPAEVETTDEPAPDDEPV